MPVPMAKMLASMMMSSASKPAWPMSRPTARWAMARRRSTDSAWPVLVEGHDHDGRPVAARQASLPQELGLTFLERDRVDDGPALGGPQPGLDDRPLRGVDHEGHAADVRLGRQEAHEARHGRLRVEQRLVHVDVQDLGAALDLLARHLDGLAVVARRERAARSAASR